jgi:cell division protein FtsB
MKKLLIAASALGALAAAAPATAQYANQGGYANANAGGAAGVQNRLARLDARIQAGVQAGTIDRNEAHSLRQQLRDISRLERQYSRNGLSQQERADLQQRVRLFRDELAMADGRGRGQYGYNNGGYGNGGYDDDDAYGQGGPYDAYCEDDTNRDRGGLGGIIDSIFGGGRNDSNNDCDRALRVGQRASGSLYAVPSHLRSRFRDGGGVVYRSDGRNVYQIDARTSVVLRVYDVD